MGIGLDLNGTPLIGGAISLGPPPPDRPEPAIVAGTRVGITRAMELEWRFSVAGNRHVSRPRPAQPPDVPA